MAYPELKIYINATSTGLTDVELTDVNIADLTYSQNLNADYLYLDEKISGALQVFGTSGQEIAKNTKFTIVIKLNSVQIVSKLFYIYRIDKDLNENTYTLQFDEDIANNYIVEKIINNWSEKYNLLDVTNTYTISTDIVRDKLEFTDTFVATSQWLAFVFNVISAGEIISITKITTGWFSSEVQIYFVNNHKIEVGSGSLFTLSNTTNYDLVYTEGSGGAAGTNLEVIDEKTVVIDVTHVAEDTSLWTATVQDATARPYARQTQRHSITEGSGFLSASDSFSLEREFTEQFDYPSYSDIQINNGVVVTDINEQWDWNGGSWILSNKWLSDYTYIGTYGGDQFFLENYKYYGLVHTSFTNFVKLEDAIEFLVYQMTGTILSYSFDFFTGLYANLMIANANDVVLTSAGALNPIKSSQFNLTFKNIIDYLRDIVSDRVYWYIDNGTFYLKSYNQIYTSYAADTDAIYNLNNYLNTNWGSGNKVLKNEGESFFDINRDTGFGDFIFTENWNLTLNSNTENTNTLKLSSKNIITDLSNAIIDNHKSISETNNDVAVMVACDSSNAVYCTSPFSLDTFASYSVKSGYYDPASEGTFPNYPLSLQYMDKNMYPIVYQADGTYIYNSPILLTKSITDSQKLYKQAYSIQIPVTNDLFTINYLKFFKTDYFSKLQLQGLTFKFDGSTLAELKFYTNE